MKILIDYKIWNKVPMTVSSLEELAAKLALTDTSTIHLTIDVTDAKVTVIPDLNRSFLVQGWYADDDFAGRWYAENKSELVETVRQCLLEVSSSYSLEAWKARNQKQ